MKKTTMKKTTNKGRTLVLFTLGFIILMVGLFTLTKLSEKPKNQVFKELPSVLDQPTMGNKDSKISIVEFGDFKCPACKAWGDDIFPRLTKEYIDTGKVSFSYVNVLFHEEESRLGALAAESIFALDPNAYWPFHKELFKAQPKEDHDAPWITLEKVLSVAKTVSPQLDTKRMEEGIQSQAIASKVQLDESLVKKYNIEQTPTIMINGTVISRPFDYQQLKSTIEKLMGEKS